MFNIGIDSGSSYTKGVLIKKENNDLSEIMAKDYKKTGVSMKKSIEKVMDKLKKESEIPFEDINIAGTGYGRDFVRENYRGKVFTEITSQARGIKELFPKCKTVIDGGGQDTKVIKMDEDGIVLDFELNDKCAAGTGRFLEEMSDVLDVDLEKFGQIAVNSDKRAKITSTCTVFAETEVVSLISEGKGKKEIIAGLTDSIASRIAGLARRVGIEEDIVMTGGMAKNIGVVKSLEKELKSEISVPEKPLYTGAIGVAL